MWGDFWLALRFSFVLLVFEIEYSTIFTWRKAFGFLTELISRLAEAALGVLISIP